MDIGGWACPGWGNRSYRLGAHGWSKEVGMGWLGNHKALWFQWSIHLHIHLFSRLLVDVEGGRCWVQKLRRHSGLLHVSCDWAKLVESGTGTRKNRNHCYSRRIFCGVPMTPFQRTCAFSLRTFYMLCWVAVPAQPCVAGVTSTYRSEEKLWVPETAQLVEQEAWSGALISVAWSLWKLKNSWIQVLFHPNPCQKCHLEMPGDRPALWWCRPALQSLCRWFRPLCSSKRPELIALLGTAAADPCPILFPPKQRFPITALQKMSKALFNYSLSQVL